MADKADVDRAETVPHEEGAQLEVGVEGVQHPQQFLEGIAIFLLAEGFILLDLPVELTEQRVHLHTRILQPLVHFQPLLLVLPPQLVPRQVEHDGVGLIEHALGSDQIDWVVLAVDLLGREGAVEEAGGNHHLLGVGVVEVAQVEGLGHYPSTIFLLYGDSIHIQFPLLRWIVEIDSRG